MATIDIMKAARNGYSESSFFYTEPFGESQRTIVWHNTLFGQRQLFFALLGKMGDKLEYLFKEDTGGKDSAKRWARIFGGIYKSDMTQLIKKHEEWFFEDSVFQLCVREPDTQGYFAYDEHGIFFIYGEVDFDMLTGLGFTEDKRELLMAAGHWHRRPKDAEERMAIFKKDLKEASVFYEDNLTGIPKP